MDFIATKNNIYRKYELNKPQERNMEMSIYLYLEVTEHQKYFK